MLGILSETYSDIICDMYSDIPCDKNADMFSDYLSEIHSDILDMYSETFYLTHMVGIFDIFFGILLTYI